MAIIMIPNIVYAAKHKNDGSAAYKNKAATVAEQLGRYGCFALMIFNIPYTYLGFYFPFAQTIYIAVNAVLLVAYCLSWIVMWHKSNLAKALLLSVIPSLIFIFSGVMIASAPLLTFAIIFAVTHILISVKNVKLSNAATLNK